MRAIGMSVGQSTAAELAMRLLCPMWRAARFPILAFLALVTPLVRFSLGALGVLCVVMAVFYGLVSPLSHRPFWTLLGFGIACGLALLAYEKLLRMISR